jgi:hypothetical protein
MEKRRPIRDLAVEKGIITEKEAEALFNLDEIAKNRYLKK